MVAKWWALGVFPNQGVALRSANRRPFGAHTSGKTGRAGRTTSLDENDQLRLSAAEQAKLDRMRGKRTGADHDLLRIWWRERLRAARRVFNDPGEVEQIVEILETQCSGR